MITKENKAFGIGLATFVVLAVLLNLLNFQLIYSILVGALVGIGAGLWSYYKT